MTPCLSIYTVSSYLGHNNSIFCASFSNPQPGSRSQLLLSASADGTARLWNATTGLTDNPCLIFSHHKHQPGEAAASAYTCSSGRISISSSIANGNSSRNRPYGSEVTSGAFFYANKFVMLVSRCGNIIRYICNIVYLKVLMICIYLYMIRR